jgi:uncharacterized protein (DUF1697 family)
MGSQKQQFAAFLRGINVGGHHKVSMADLKSLLQTMGYSNITTLLNSGNVLFEAKDETEQSLEHELSAQLELTFGFSIPVIVRRHSLLKELVHINPFREINISKDTRLYVSFLIESPAVIPDLPVYSADGTYTMLEIQNNNVFSVLDLAAGGTTKAMDELERLFGKGITTRNWNTVVKLVRA